VGQHFFDSLRRSFPEPWQRLDGIQEVSGSIPLISTKSLDFFGNQGFFLFLSLVMCDFLRFSSKASADLCS
jgi:hypothetical protein